MKECKNGQKNAKKQLKNFIETIKNHAYRYRKLYQKLYYWEHQLDLIPGPVYGGVTSLSNVKENRLPIIIDKIDECKNGLAKIAEEKRQYREFVMSLTDKEAVVLHFVFWEELSFSKTANRLSISNTRVNQIKSNIEKKWLKFIEEKAM